MFGFSQLTEEGDRIDHRVESVLAAGRTRYQAYEFFRSPAHGVCVALDGDIQSCEADEAIYHEALVHPAMLLHPQPRRVLIMGGGEGATAREVLRHPGVEEVVMVDIDERFIELCRVHLAGWDGGAFEDPRLTVECRDINEYLERARSGFDVVIGDLVDCHDWASPAAALYGRDLYARLCRSLSEAGVVATQAGGLTVNRVEGHRRVRRVIRSQFAGVASYATVVPSFHHLWSFVVASTQSLPSEDLPELLYRRAGERGVTLPATGAASLAAAFTLPQAIARGIEE